MLTDEEQREELEEFLLGWETPKARLLWEIFFETDFHDIELLENRIYEYGAIVKAEDYLDRELFVGMVALLNQLKKKNQTD